ncbi:MAG: hypothetical protein ACFFAS_01695 [Promethearchaeota archaeon]
MIEQKILKVDSLPKWQADFTDPSSMVSIGDTIHTTLKPKGSPTLEESMAALKTMKLEQRYQVVNIRVKNQDPVEIQLHTDASCCERLFKSKALGIPAIILIGEDILPSSGWNAILSNKKLPGIPIAFAMGTYKKPASLKFRPERDGYLKVAFWLIRGSLDPLKISTEENELESTYPEAKISRIITEELCIRAWEGTDFTLPLKYLKWKKRKVTLTIRKGPDDAPLPKNLLENALSRAGVDLNLILTNEQERWMKIVDKSNSTITCLEKQIDTWISKRRKQDIINDDFKVLLNKLNNWCNHPYIQGPLMSLERLYRGWSEQEIEISKLFNEARGEKANLEVLESNTTLILSKLLEDIGAIEGIIMDKRGEVVAAIKPGFTLNLSEQDSWKILEANDDKDILITEPHVLKNYDFFSRTIAKIIRDTNNIFLGWILLELYIEPI